MISHDKVKGLVSDIRYHPIPDINAKKTSNQNLGGKTIKHEQCSLVSALQTLTISQSKLHRFESTKTSGQLTCFCKIGACDCMTWFSDASGQTRSGPLPTSAPWEAFQGSRIARIAYLVGISQIKLGGFSRRICGMISPLPI